MLVDEVTRCKHSFFLKRKSDKIISRCDNAGENKKLEEQGDAEGLGIIFEYTATGSPQQYAYVERAFPTLMGRARAMMNFVGFTTEKRKQLWYEAANTATMHDNSGFLHKQI